MTAPVGSAVRWAIVGLGIHAVERMLPAFQRARQSPLAGVYSPRAEVTRDVARTYGVRGYASFEEMLVDQTAQVLYLATPHDVHKDQTVQAARAGKHVLVEKPMALSVDDAAAMVRACAAARVKLYVGFHLRFHPAHQRVRALVRAGAIGDVVWAGARWVSYRPPDVGWRLDLRRAGGTLLTARGVHLLDLLRFTCATEFASISGASDGLRADKPADDTTAGTAVLASGGVAQMVCSRLVPGGGNDLEIYGTRGSIVCRSTIAAEPKGRLTVAHGRREETNDYETVDVLAVELDRVSSAIAGHDDGVCASGEDGLRVAAVTAGLIESVQTGRTVALHYPGLSEGDGAGDHCR
jgi:1,5-anhydro-D-fructose reductase (1,5-anhydro-D-mannitol-forming)